MASEGARRADNSNNKPTSKITAQDWTTARCHRLIRPLSAKLQSLKCLLQSPSLSAPIDSPIPPKETKETSDEAAYHPSQEKGRLRRTTSANGRSLFYGQNRPRDRPRQIYSSSSSSTAPQVVVTMSPSMTTSVYDLPFPSATVNYGGTGNAAAAESVGTRPKANHSKEQLDPSHPQVLLQSIRPNMTHELHQIYKGIYSALENVLVSTIPPSIPGEAVSLKVLAARKIAHCILATNEELGSDDVWYDTASDIGLGGEYLREIVRWHAIELVREAICLNILPSRQKSGLGLPGILVGLCKHLCAEAEAESLLKTMFELYPLSEHANNPALVALFSFWRSQKSQLCRLLPDVLVEEGSPVALGNASVNEALRAAVNRVENCQASKDLVSKALEAAFGIWGNSYIAAAAKQRKELARRKGGRRRSEKIDDEPGHARKPSNGNLPFHIRARAETMALNLTEKLVVAARSPHNSAALEIVEDLARGFLVQHEATRTSTEDKWTTSYPVAGKVMVLLQILGRDPEQDIVIINELVRCLDDLRDEMGKEGFKSLGKFVASCYENLYTSNGKSISEGDEMKTLISRLILYASTESLSGHVDHADTVSAMEPKTPLKRNHRVVTFTPGRVPTDSQRERKRYFLTQLALNVAIGFSTLDCAKKNEEWNTWLRKVEYQIIGMKVWTPVKPKAANNNSKEGPKERKGWRWEEGIDEWVQVGGTPGGALKKQARKITRSSTSTPPATLFRVEIPVNKLFKRDEHEVFSDAIIDDDEVSVISPEDSEDGMDEDFTTDEVPTDTITVAEDSEEEDMPSPPSISDSEDPDTSYSRIFEGGPESSESDYEDDAKDEYYAPTPARPPSSVRRSPRKTELIKRSLHAFSVMIPSSSPMISKPTRSAFNVNNPTAYSSPPASPRSVNTDTDEEIEDAMAARPPKGRNTRLPVERDSSPSPCRSTIENDEADTQSVLSILSGNTRSTRSTRSKRKHSDADLPYEESDDELSMTSNFNPQPRKTRKKRRSLLCVTADKKQEDELPRRRLRKKRPTVFQVDDGFSEDELL
ncbi:hypothetical protein FN846DRAFT_950044 [Sphaerosporella brunnea]|uniref:Uncharacterized protein n=1 Tax=Sphaerosporella brunnea TaxID=1250544 RepID=A0A5J5EWP2_9PEZI|nr:hypothetical protein FN846DRAFT_950044 [Sphaerosporella brunnea]